MSRAISRRYKVNCNLKAVSPIHVGGIGDDALVDLALAVNGRGEYYIPGTSLAGALRSWMEQWETQTEHQNLWGFQDEDKGHASFAIVEDALVHLPNGAIAEIRDGVGIDRCLGAAADQIKYDRAILPNGAWFLLELTLEAKTNNEVAQVERTIDILMTALSNSDIRLGAAKTRGLGRVQLEDKAEIYFQELQKPKGVLAALRGNGQAYHYKIERHIPPQLLIEISWKPRDPVMVKAEAEGIAVNILPLVSTVDRQLALVLPGSSIKGALRFQAERMIGTLKIKADEINTTTAKQKFFSRLELPLIKTIFGTSKTNDLPSENREPLPGLGALWVEDCYSTERMESQKWQDIAQAKDDKALLEALEKAGLEKTQQAYHVAVDRWTGGAAEQMLYSSLEPFEVNWDKLHLTLNFNRIPENERLPAIAFILLILRDLSQNRIPLGYAVNRGMGAIAVENILIKGCGLMPNYVQPISLNLEQAILQNLEQGITCKNGDITTIDAALLNPLNKAWETWLKSNQKNQEVA